MAKQTPEEQIQDGYSVLIDTVTNNLFHSNYKRVVALASKYHKLITGEDSESLLRKFTRREDDELFKQRVELTSLITPSVSEAIMNPFYKVGRTNNINSKIDFKGSENFERKLEDLKKVIQEYNGNKSLTDYLDVRLVDLNFSDPNAFIVTEFDEVEKGAQGELLEKVKPRPFEVSSEEAVNYFYKNNVLQWLVVRLPITYIDNKEVVQSGYSYTIYLPDVAIKFTQIDLTGDSIAKGKLIETGSEYKYYRADETRLFQVEEFTYNAGQVPAVRVGYKLDKATKGQTMVSPMHAAMPYFMKSIKTVSEFDLTMALHAFPQKFQYVNKCMGAKGLDCNSGKTTEGNTCSMCNGTGISIHASAQDAVVMRIPKDKDEMINLEQMVHYEYPPIDLLKFQKEFIDDLEIKAKKAVFTSENVTRTSATKTATEMDYAYEDIYDTLYPYAVNYSSVYKNIVTVSSAFVDVKDVIIEYKFPKDFKFKTTEELLNELKLANDSSAPGYIKQELSIDIAAQQYLDKPEELKRIIAKQKYYPFPDKNFTEIAFIISNDLTSKYNKVLYSNFDNIFLKLEQEAEEKNQYFYDYAPKLQKELIDIAVNDLINLIGSESSVSIGFKDTSVEDIGGGG